MDALAHRIRQAATTAKDLQKILYQAAGELCSPRLTAAYLDLDGLLVDFIGGALQAFGAGRGQLTPGEWHVDKCLGVTTHEFWKRCKGHDFWANLQPLSDWRDILRAVTDHFRPERVFLMSSPSTDAGCYSGKYEWVVRHLPHMERRFTLTTNKGELARPGAVLIDDSEENVAAWQAGGGEAFLFPRFQNKRHAEDGRGVELLAGWLKDLNHRM